MSLAGDSGSSGKPGRSAAMQLKLRHKAVRAKLFMVFFLQIINLLIPESLETLKTKLSDCCKSIVKVLGSRGHTPNA